MDLAIKIVLLAVFFGVMIGIGLYCRRHATDVSGFVLGGRSVGPWLTAFAYGTSYFSAVVFVGYAGQFGWKYGVAATWAGLGNAFLGSLLAWAVLGRRTRVMTQHLDSATMPEFFGKRFDSRALKLCASVIIFIFLIPYTASLYNGLSRLFGMAFAIDYSVCVVVMAILTGVYVIATVFALVVAGGCYFLGGFGRLYADRIDIQANGYDSIIPAMLSGLPAILIAVVVILVLSASMSTLSSLVLASSSTLTLDFIKGNIIKDMDEKRQVRWMRGLVVVFIAISVVLALIQYKSSVTFIAQLMGVSWGALAGSFLAPFLYGLYWKRTTKAACWVSFVFSAVFMLAVISPLKTALPPLLQSPINAGAFCMIAGLVIVPAVSLFTRAPGEKRLEEIFSCYERRVTVTVKDSIGEQNSH